MNKVLQNIIVLDFTQVFAGPFCTLILKELGADVIKIEIPKGGDSVRWTPPHTEGGESYCFINLNRGKKGITLNLKSDRGRQICRELVEKADIVVENYSPGTMHRLGLSYEELTKVNPHLIYTSISGFGQTGPRSLQPAFDIIAQALSGLMSVTGFPDGPPTKVGPSVVDFMGGLYGVIGTLAALRHKTTKGEGQYVDIALLDCGWISTAIEFATWYFSDGQIPQREGNSMRIVGPGYGLYPTADGNIVIAIVNLGQWQRLLKLIGRDDLSYIETRAERIRHWHELDAAITEWTRTKNVEEIVDKFSQADVPTSPIHTIDQVCKDPQLLSREMIKEVTQTISGRVKVPGSVLKLSKTPVEADLPAPFLGEHNNEVYSNILGYSEEEINQLITDGII